jgi:hypothetical protein
LLSVSPALPALWELGGLTHACPTATLVRSLWHRNEPQEPLRQTRNKSLPGAHLASSPKLQGHVFGLVLSGANSDAVEAALREQGIAQLARATKVSISRFVRVVELAQSGLAEDSMPCGLNPCAVLLAFLWMTASSKSCLLDFLEAAATHLPPASLLGGEYNAVCERWRARWSESAYTQQCAADGSPSASAAASSLSGLTTWPPAAEAVELLAFALASRGNDRPDVEQSRHGYRGQAEVADCVEAIARDTLSLALWDGRRGRFEPSRLPPTADEALVHFFAREGFSSGHRCGALWFSLCAARPGIHYLSGGGAECYEVHPSLPSFHSLLESLLGMPLAPPGTGQLLPILEGCPLGWEVRG